MSQTHQKANCSECGDEFDCPIRHIANPYCRKHVGSQNTNLQNLTQTIKEEYKKQKNADGSITTVIPIKINEKGQILGALNSNAAEAQRMGAPWMTTEFVENGSDAIKQNRQICNSGQETKHNYGNNFSEKGTIILEIDQTKMELRIIDNGTGIMDPFWIIQNPFKSMKADIDYLIGNFGRGLTGFRGLCTNLDYITLRSHFLPGSIEDKQQEKSLCAKVSFDNTPEGKYTSLKEKEFRKYTQNKTGTVAILSHWKNDEWERLWNDKPKLLQRMKLHFGHATTLDNFEIFVKTIKDDGTEEIEKIEPINFTGLEPLYVEKRPLTNYDTKQVVGNINFYLYKSRPSEGRDFKEPYLLIQNRPLQDSKVCQLDGFQDNPVWKSKYLTGYIECDFIHPNELRNAIDRDQNHAVFHRNLKAITTDIDKELQDYLRALKLQDKETEFKEVRDTFQNYIQKNNIKWNTTAFKMSGKLTQGLSGKSTNQGKISATEGGANEGLIAEDGTDVTIISKEIKKRKPPVPGGPKGVPVAIKDPKSKNGLIPMKNGKNQKIVYVNPTKSSRGGVRKKKTITGPDFVAQKQEIIPKLSWYEPSSKAIVVNAGHDVYKKLDTNKGSGGFSQKMKEFLMEQYAWNFFIVFGEEKGDSETDQLQHKAYEFFKAVHNIKSN